MKIELTEKEMEALSDCIEMYLTEREGKKWGDFCDEYAEDILPGILEKLSENA